MKRMLRPTALALALVPILAFGAAACGGGDPESGEPTATAQGPETPEIGEAASDATGTPEADDEAGAAAEGEEAAAPTSGTPPTPDPTVVALAERFEPPMKGDPDAPILVYEFSDYRCPYCRSFFAETLPGFTENYIDTGKAALVFIDFPLPSHGYPAVLAAELAHCSGEQDRYWEMHDAIFEAFAPLNDVDPEDEEASTAGVWAVAEAADLGLDMEALEACYRSQKYRPIIAALVQQSRDSGVEATPTLLIVNGDYQEGIPGFLPYEDFARILDREWSRHLGTPIPTETSAPAPDMTMAAATAAATGEAPAEGDGG